LVADARKIEGVVDVAVAGSVINVITTAANGIPVRRDACYKLCSRCAQNMRDH
jgi:hypothetical protein